MLARDIRKGSNSSQVVARVPAAFDSAHASLPLDLTATPSTPAYRWVWLCSIRRGTAPRSPGRRRRLLSRRVFRLPRLTKVVKSPGRYQEHQHLVFARELQRGGTGVSIRCPHRYGLQRNDRPTLWPSRTSGQVPSGLRYKKDTRLSGDGRHRCPGDPADVMSHQGQALPEKRRVQVVEEELLDEFTPAAHPDLLEDAAEMVLDGVLRDKEYLGDTCRGEATHDELH